LTKNSINEDNTSEMTTCQYKHPKNNIFPCRNQGTYECPHCSIFFCLQHGLQHQESLKEEITTCQYKHPSTNIFPCRNQGTYECPHCNICFCLQHGLQHQEDLKEEIRTLLTRTQVKFI
jgi:hypothetical protein